MAVSITYLVHDLADAAVARRIASFAAAGSSVRLAGFFRRHPPPAKIAGTPALALGRTRDARLGQRVLLVLRNWLMPQRLAPVVAGADVIIARNLEMLVIAARLRQPGQRLVYECLDIHRMMLRPDLPGRVMRAIERRSLRRADLVLVSSPAFERDYFRKVQQHSGPITLVENKVAALPETSAAPLASGNTGQKQTWTIGWFGMLRCRRSLSLLGELSAASQGRITILIAGIPSPNEFPEFSDAIARMNGVEFAGHYTSEDLPRLYGRVDFAWCIDYFEEGLNSRWLLPNRLYESIAHGVVPVALRHVETGRWLTDAGVGLTIADGAAFGPLLKALSQAQYQVLRNQVAALPRSRIAFAPHDHRRLVERLAGAAVA